MHAGDQTEALYHIVTSSLFTCIRYGDAAVSELMLPVLGEATEAVKLSLKALMVYAVLLFTIWDLSNTDFPVHVIFNLIIAAGSRISFWSTSKGKQPAREKLAS
jgi:hypothetical protein